MVLFIDNLESEDGSRGVNLGGRGDTSPQNLEWGTPMYNVPPDFDIFLWSLLRASAKDTLYSIYFIDKQLPLRSINHYPLVARAKQK